MKQQKLIILIGLSASGKTRYATEYIRKNENTAIISTDKIKKDMSELNIHLDNETEVYKEMKHRVRKTLLHGRSAIVNATNLKIKYREPFIKLAKKINPDIKIEAHVIVAPIDDCIERDSSREKIIGKDKILKQVGEFQIPVKGEGFDEIYFTYKSDNIDESAEDIDATGLMVFLLNGTYNKMKSVDVGQATSILCELDGKDKNVQTAAFFLLLSKALTTGQSFAQFSAYLLLCQLLRLPLLMKNDKKREEWFTIIQYINYAILPNNWSDKYNFIFDKNFIDGIKSICKNLNLIKSIEDVQNIYNNYYKVIKQ